MEFGPPKSAPKGRTKLIPWSISLLLHLLVIPFVVPVYESQASNETRTVVPPAPLKLISSKTAKQLLKAKQKPKPPPKTAPQKLPKAPVVSLSRLTKEIANKKARYLATVNNQTMQETVSRHRGLQQKQTRRRSVPRGTEGRPSPNKMQRQANPQTQTNRRQTQSGKLKPNTQAPEVPQHGQPLTSLSSLDALLFQASRDNTTANRGTPEDIKGVAAGDETILNTRAYKHSWFFNRVVGALYQHWRANEAHRAHDPTGKVYGIRDRKTIIAVVLDMSGNLVDARILETSGAPHLDDEALAAFRRAQPFPNPPTELGDTDGRIRFPMGFRLEFGQPQFFRMR